MKKSSEHTEQKVLKKTKMEDSILDNEFDELESVNQTNAFTLKNAFIIGLILIAIFLVLFISTLFQKSNNSLSENVAYSPSKTIRINEYMTKNMVTFKDEDYDSTDWVEIYNYGSNPVWVGDVYISDDIKNPDKFLLPDVYIEPDGYLLVLASGKAKDESEHIHANFKLSEDDSNIILFYENSIISQIEIEYLPQDISAGYSKDGSFGYFAQPTPGNENTDEIYTEAEIESINPIYGTLIINEYVANNDYGIVNSLGQASDWVEIYNPGSNPVNMSDYYLSDDEYRLNKYNLPDKEIAPGEYVVIFAYGEEEASMDEYTAPFSISEYDKMLILSYKSGQIADTYDVYNMPADVSAGIDENGERKFFSISTPGSANTSTAYDTYEIQAEYTVSSPLLINEWMPNNEFGIVDAFGDASDWIEIYNPSTETISLDGYGLTDDITEPKKWIFPSDIQIEGDSYVLVYMSGKDTVLGSQLHAGFKLGEDETLYLTAPNSGIVDSAVMESMPGNVSKGITEDGYGYFALPTPGQPNTSDYVTEIKKDISFLHSSLYFSEVSSGTITAVRSYGKYTYEYIEIYNPTEETISLSGYSIMQADGKTFTFSDEKIRPDKYIVVSVKGYIKKELGYIKGENLSLNSAGEQLFLKNAAGIIIDSFDTGYLLGDISSGRLKSDDNTRVFFTTKTPGYENISNVYTAYSVKPLFSHLGGMVNDAFALHIEAEGSSRIYYTLDGSIPSSETGTLYTGPIEINDNAVVRAVSQTEGMMDSLCMTSTYIFDIKHDIPIVCLSSAPGGLFSSAGGIYADGYGHDDGEYPYFGSNYFWNLEREVSFEYYLEDNTIAVEFDGGIQIAGAYSRALPQKSLVIRLRDEYGLSEVDYPFFDTGNTTFKHILLRNSGQDHFMTKMRDAYILNCATDLGTVDCKRARPVAVYINAEYWGMYNMRDKLNADYIRLKYGYDDDVQINYLTHFASPKKGDTKDWELLKDFCYSNDFNIKENYDKLGEWVDIDAFIDYFIVQITFSNRDSHNISFWKAETEGGKWRPILYDMDLALLPNEVDLVELHLGNNNLGYDDCIKKALVSSEFFEEEFLQRFSYVLNNIYTEEYLSSNIDDYKSQIQNEIVYHMQRWPYPVSYEKWEGYIEAMRTQVLKSRNEIPGELQDFFSLSDAELAELFPWYEK